MHWKLLQGWRLLSRFTGQKGTSVSDNALHNVLSNQNLELTVVGDSLAELIKALGNVDENDKLAELNETTISDNNGGRIQL